MAIYKRDRSFNKILNEVTMDTVPLQFIKRIRVSMRDGSVMTLGPEDVTEFNSVDDLLMNSTISADIADMAIELDHDLIENHVKTEIQSILDVVDNESNTRM